jgi:hypothetical protein
MSVDFDMNGPVSNDETREQIRAELEKLLRDRDERWRVSIQSPLSHAYYWLTAIAPGFERRTLLYSDEVTASFIVMLLREWLSEFAWLVGRRKLPG